MRTKLTKNGKTSHSRESRTGVKTAILAFLLLALLATFIGLNTTEIYACPGDVKKPPTPTNGDDKPPPCDDDDCDDDCKCKDENKNGSTCSAQSEEPILYASGVVREQVTDLAVPGKVFPWRHSRSYSSRLAPADPQDTLPSIQGEKWFADALLSFVVEEDGNVAVYLDATYKRVFTTAQGGGYNPPNDYLATLTHDTTNHVYVLTFDRSGNIYKFRDYHDSWPAHDRGTLKERTNRYGAYRLEFSYGNVSTSRRPTNISLYPSGSQTADWQVNYGYLTSSTQANLGKICKIGTVTGGEDQYVFYTYMDSGSSYHADVGTAGDLIAVHSCRGVVANGIGAANSTTIILQDSGSFSGLHLTGWKIVARNSDTEAPCVRTIASNTADSVTVAVAFPWSLEGKSYYIARDVEDTLYRYGNQSFLKAVYQSGSIQRIVEDNANVADASDILSLSDTAVIKTVGQTNVTLAEYADRSFTYYTSDLNTSNAVSTDWSGAGTENLGAKYGGANFDETGYAKSETVRGRCATCGGGSANGVTYTYYYMQLHDGSSADCNAVVKVVVEDIKDSSGNFVRRQIHGLNTDRVSLRSVTAVGDISAPQYWCESVKLGAADAGDGSAKKVTERRQVSAHTKVTHASGLIDEFLDPTGNAGANDTGTINGGGDSAGAIQLVEYNTAGYPIREKIKNTKTGSAYFVRVTAYGDGTNDPAWLMKSVYEYPQETTTEGDASRLLTSYGYTYHDGAKTQVKTKTITHPTVTTDHNGSNSATARSEYYDAEGLLRYVKDETGRVNYNEYDSVTGRVKYSVTDIKTNAPPAQVTLGTVPDGFGTTEGLNLLTQYQHDSEGRTTKVTDPNGIVTYRVYLPNQTRVYPAWDASTSKPILPVQVTVTNDSNQTTETYSVDPTNVTFSSIPDGSETLPQSAYVEWTKYNYNDQGQMEWLRSYHNIPASGEGEIATNYYQTTYAYDAQGQKILITAPTGAKTYTVYDQQGRTIETWVGTDATGATQSNPAGEGTNNLKKIAATFYDEATIGGGTSGVGDGYATSTRSYHGSGANDYVKTMYHYDYRGRLRGTDSQGHDGSNWQTIAPVSVQDVDNMGRSTAAAEYTAAPTWSTVLTDADYAATIATNRRALSETLYDEKGQAYRSVVHEIDPSDGSDDGSMATNYWYDAAGRTIKVKDPAGLFSKTVYDGAGRATESYVCHDDDETAYADADDTDGDTILRVTVNVYVNDRLTETKLGTSTANAVAVQKTWYDSTHDGNGTNRPYVTGVSTIKPKATLDSDATDYVVTTYEYDSAGRQSATVGPDPDGAGDLKPTRVERVYDDLGRVTSVKTYKDDTTDVLLARTDTAYGAAGVTSVKTYKINGTPPAAGDSLETVYSYDGMGRRVKATQPSGAFSKTVYTAWGRVTGSYLGTAEGNTTDADNVTDDTIVEQSVPTYDYAGRVIQTTAYQRTDSSGKTGDLSSSWAASDSRRTFSCTWFDGLGRASHAADYGDNGGADLSRPATAPEPNTSDTVLVVKYEYDGYGRNHKVTDNKGRVAMTFFDSYGRRTHVAENYDNFNASNDAGTGDGSDASKDRVTKFVYLGPTSLLSEQVALDADGDGNLSDNQGTRYVWQAELSAGGCAVPDGTRLRAIIYPDSDDTVAGQALSDGGDTNYDRVELTYLADGNTHTRKDQRGSIRTFGYDDLGRLTSDAVTTAGTGVDTAVLRIERSYDDFDRAFKVTSYDAASGGSVVNEVSYAYNGVGQVEAECQEHRGAADSDTLCVRYGYDDTAAGGVLTKGMRLKSVRYPSVGANQYTRTAGEVAARLHHLTYGAADGVDDRLSRLAAQKDDSGGSPNNTLSGYTYLGARTVVVEDYEQPDVRLTYKGASAGQYDGLDRFGRVVSQTWYDYGASADRDRHEYTYDRASNRLTRDNTLTAGLDEKYTYDGLDRLTAVERGTLSGGSITSKVRAAAWGLSQTGNWATYQLDANGDGDYTDAGDLDQTRTHDAVNQITGISEEQGQTAWADPAHDPAGNGTTLPRPGDESNTFTCVYDAWNRLVEVKVGATTIERNEYDGLNRRVVKQFDSAAPADPDGLDAYRHYYYNSAWQILETRKSAGAATAPQTLQPEWQYVWSPRYLDAAVLRDRNSDADDLCDDERLYYCNDANMNVTALTDENGDAVERYAYDAYGQPTVYDGTWSNTRSASSYDNEILYCGYVFDWPTRLYHVRRRPYHSTMGKWNVRDPKDQDIPGGGYHDGMSLYEYVRSRPTVLHDPSGLAPNPTWKDASGCDGANEPDPVYDQRMMDEMWNRAMYHYDCQHGLNGRTDCPDVPGGHEQAYQYWLKQHEKYREQYNRNKGGGKGIYMCDYYDLRVTCDECIKSGHDIAQARCEHEVKARMLKFLGQAGTECIETGVGVACQTIGGGIVYYAPGWFKLIGVPFLAYGGWQVAETGDAIGRASDIKQTGQDAMAKYCNCEKVVK